MIEKAPGFAIGAPIPRDEPSRRVAAVQFAVERFGRERLSAVSAKRGV